ncbi:MAG: hypothetical protein HY910_05930 [Desulfarculus sp.]|nr:hypothetical protein [Desulfarculus sp.]
MRTPLDSVEIDLGPARLRLEPLEPWVWQEEALAAPGPASLCLELLSLARPGWQGVATASQAPAPPTAANLAAMPAAALDPLLKALCPPWLTPPEEAGLLALERYLLAFCDFPGLDCAACQDQEARGEGHADCAACPRPTPPPEAGPALALYPLLSGLSSGGAWAASWLPGLPPRRARLLAMRLALIGRLRPGRRGGPGLPPAETA